MSSFEFVNWDIDRRNQAFTYGEKKKLMNYFGTLGLRIFQGNDKIPDFRFEWAFDGWKMLIHTMIEGIKLLLFEKT